MSFKFMVYIIKYKAYYLFNFKSKKTGRCRNGTWMISFVMDDESHMIFNLNISSVNSKALFNKNDNISDSFAKGLGKYFDAKNINADFYIMLTLTNCF